MKYRVMATVENSFTTTLSGVPLTPLYQSLTRSQGGVGAIMGVELLWYLYAQTLADEPYFVVYL
jgi:hypothetical protein